MVITKEDIATLIPNTSMQKVYRDGVFNTYYITPNEGYVLHDKAYDAPVYDDYGNETGEIILGYRTSQASCPASYDFTANPREFYAVLASSVPADQIFGGGNDHETA
jgi:hypothetical protein